MVNARFLPLEKLADAFYQTANIIHNIYRTLA